MVFHFLAGLVSLATSSIVYVIGSIIFAKDFVTLVAFFVSLLAIMIIIGVARVIFAPSGRGLKSSMHGMRSKGYSLRSMAYMFKRNMEREIISGSVARAFAFGTILFLTTNNLLVIYITAAVGLGSGLLLMFAHRHHFVDLVSGAIIGLGVGFLSLKFTPLLIALF